MYNSKSTCIQLIIIGLLVDPVFHRFGTWSMIVTAAILGFSVILVSDFFRLTNGTFRWRWRNFSFKDEFTNRYYYTESLSLGALSITGCMLAHDIVGLLK